MTHRIFILIAALMLVGCGGKKKDAQIQTYREYIYSLKQQKQKLREELGICIDSLRRDISRLEEEKRFLETTLETRPIYYATSHDIDTLTRVRYTNKINGFKVTAYWQPEQLLYGKVVGKAIINFKKGDKQFSMVHSTFFINSTYGEDNLFAQSIDFERNILYEFKYPKYEGCHAMGLREDVPFFFTSDGKYLVLMYYGMGQRGVDTYRFYEMEDSMCEQDDLYQPTYKEPFVDFDSLSTIEGDTVVNTSSGGADSWSRKTYVKKGEEWNLVQVEEQTPEVPDTIYTYRPSKKIIKRQYDDMYH